MRLAPRAINHALQNIPLDRVRLHVCWGNSEGPHIYDVPLEEIIEILYEANVGALVMEMEGDRGVFATELLSYMRCHGMASFRSWDDPGENLP